MWGSEKTAKLRLAIIMNVLIIGVMACLGPVLGCDRREEMTNPKASLKKVSVEYWTARFIDKDYKTTYEMELGNESIPFETYLKRVQNKGQIQYSSVELKSVDIEGDQGKVTLHVDCRTPASAKVGTTVTIPLNDTWILRSGRWQHVPPEEAGSGFSMGEIKPNLK